MRTLTQIPDGVKIDRLYATIHHLPLEVAPRPPLSLVFTLAHQNSIALGIFSQSKICDAYVVCDKTGAIFIVFFILWSISGYTCVDCMQMFEGLHPLRYSEYETLNLLSDVLF